MPCLPPPSNAEGVPGTPGWAGPASLGWRGFGVPPLSATSYMEFQFTSRETSSLGALNRRYLEFTMAELSRRLDDCLYDAPERDIWPAKSRLQGLLERSADRVLLVWDALRGDVTCFEDGEGVQKRCTNLNRMFGRKPSRNPEYDAFWANRPKRTGDTITLRKPQRFVASAE